MSERKGTRALELWCKRLVRDCPNVRIDNMTSSWRDGIAFCALVHHFRPDLIDPSTLRPENIYENNQLAFSIAEKHLGIPALLDAEDMVANVVPDRLSVLTYLSQFYQRLGHTVNTKANESDSNVASTPSPAAPSSALNMFGKSALDKCAACDLPVYLAQRLIVSHKLYHRRCFRCSKCSGHLNPNNFKNFVGTEFVCDSCKNDTVSKLLNNNDAAMGMLAFSDSLPETEIDNQITQPVTERRKSRPQSILDKINMFEKNDERDSMSDKLENLSIKDMQNVKNYKDKEIISSPSIASTSQGLDKPAVELKTHQPSEEITTDPPEISKKDIWNDKTNIASNYESVYKSDVRKYTFLKTQLFGDIETDAGKEKASDTEKTHISDCEPKNEDKNGCNVTDDTRLAKSVNQSDMSNHSDCTSTDAAETSISIPPRRKKRPSSEITLSNKNDKSDIVKNEEDYPDSLNPFGDDDEGGEACTASPKNSSTNPFGSDDEDDEVPEMTQTASTTSQQPKPERRLISANPFWSDGEEPSSDEDTHDNSSMYQSSIATSTPNLRVSTPRRRKAPPPPPPAITVTSLAEAPATSTDDVASLSSVSSYNSAAHSDYRSLGKLTPQQRKRAAPTPPDSVSTLSGGSRHGGSTEKMDGSRRAKGPAPGLPLPARRAVRLQVSPAQLQTQLDLLETQQLGLERQGVQIEQMIRDKCEGEDAAAVPQDEVEDLVIQLCELVNEKNDLFRKQTELMYIRRQQRLEQEQADIEHEIRVIQSRPAVNRIDADKAREEQLVSRLVEIVRLRDELVQQLDSERRRERQEDLAIAASIANKRGSQTVQHLISRAGSSWTRSAGASDRRTWPSPPPSPTREVVRLFNISSVELAAAGLGAPARATGGPGYRRLHRQQER